MGTWFDRRDRNVSIFDPEDPYLPSLLKNSISVVVVLIFVIVA